jgi:glycosyltransferase involved in cell wall biosynthesis
MGGTPVRLRVGVYDLYWSTLGGGEQVDGSIAQVLAADHDVTLLGPEPVDIERTRERLGLDLSGCGFRRVVDDADATAASGQFDVFVNGTYLSRAECRAPLGYYYVHFPGAPPRRGDGLRQRVCIGGVKALSLLPQLPQRLREVQAGFDRRIRRVEYLPTYHRYLANSEFTAGWVRRLWRVRTDVLYPPVRPTVAPGTKERLILNVGRFFDPSKGHSKKQLDLVAAFTRLHQQGRLDGWRLALAGGCDPANRDYALAVRRAAVGLPVDVHVNATGATVERLLAAASIYWHGAGFAEDPQRHPHRFEHFGIALVEAMAAGAVPVVFGAAGPAEIVRDGLDGRHWHSLDELEAITTTLADDDALRRGLAGAAVARAADFSFDLFARRLGALLDEDRRRLPPDMP